MSPRRPPSGFSLPGLTPGVKWLMIAVAAVSVGVSALGAWIAPDRAEVLYRFFAFTPAELWHGRIWQPLTFTFLNPAPIDLLLALLMLWMFAGQLEREWGTRRFLRFFFSSVALAGVATAALGLAVGSIAFHTYVGIWTAVEALSAAFAVTWPDAQILLFFVVPVRARYLIHLALGITGLFILMTGSVAPFVPPLFGLGAGVLFSGRGTLDRLLLRSRVWWIDRRLRRSKLRVVKGKPDDAFGVRRGSDKYLH